MTGMKAGFYYCPKCDSVRPEKEALGILETEYHIINKTLYRVGLCSKPCEKLHLRLVPSLSGHQGKAV